MPLLGATPFPSTAEPALERAMAVLDLAFAWVLKCVVPGVHFLWEPGNPILLPAVVAFLHPL